MKKIRFVKGLKKLCEILSSFFMVLKALKVAFEIVNCVSVRFLWS